MGGGAPARVYIGTMEPMPLWLMTRNPALRDRWSRWLSAEGWSVVELPAGDALASLPRGRAGSLLVDAALLKESDMPALRNLSAARIPVILFGEGPAAASEQVVRWLESGADDFIPTSIHERLLIAKLQAYARRIRPEADRKLLISRKRRLKADVEKRLAWTRAEGQDWKLTPALTATEHRLLSLFLSVPETLLERRFILGRVWGEKADQIYMSTLTQHIMSLRKKLGPEGDSIKTVYGRGYILLEEK